MTSTWNKESARYRTYFRNIIAAYKQRKDVKIFLELILSMTTISIFLIFAFRPTFLTIIELIKEIKTKEETIVKMDRKIKNLKLAESLHNQKQDQINLLKIAIPDTPLPETFVQQIGGLANKHAVVVSEMTINSLVLKGKVETKKNVKKRKKEDKTNIPLPEGAKSLSFSISTTGNYQSLIAFLTELENLLRPVQIDSGYLTSSDLKSQSPVFTIEGQAPYLK